MTPQQLAAWTTVAVQIISTVTNGIKALRSIFSIAGLTHEQQDAIIDAVMADAKIQERLAHLASGRPD